VGQITTVTEGADMDNPPEAADTDKLPATVPAIEDWLQRIMLASRWILIVFYVVLTLALAAFAVAFVVSAASLAPRLFAMRDSELILSLLGLVDSSLVASLVVMVIISGYDNFVGQINQPGQTLPWLGSLDSGALKIKIAAAIVAISSIHLLELALNADHYTNGELGWGVTLQVAFVLTAVGLGLVERLTRH